MRFSGSLIDYFLDENYKVIVACLENPFENKYQKSNLEIKKLKNNLEKIDFFKKLQGELLITTTPSLGTAIFPTSKAQPTSSRPKSVYLFHSLVSPNEMYVKNSFKHFDYIFSPSSTITNHLSTLVSRNTQIIDTGYLLFNDLNPFEFKSHKSNKILIAPTWGSGVLEITKNMNLILNYLNSTNYEIVFRPHPMTDVSTLNIEDQVVIDRSKNLINLQDYNYLITDYSGIALEYFYLTERPTIFLNVNKKIKRKLSKNELDLTLIENEMRSIIGVNINIEEFNNLDLNKVVIANDSANFANKINSHRNSLYLTTQAINNILSYD